MGGSLDFIRIAPNAVMNHTGKYVVDAPHMYAKERLWCPKLTPNHYLHVEMHIDTFL